jgi:hypothetical protein
MVCEGISLTGILEHGDSKRSFEFWAIGEVKLEMSVRSSALEE